MGNGEWGMVNGESSLASSFAKATEDEICYGGRDGGRDMLRRINGPSFAKATEDK